jgi:hypothetical protein
MWAAQFWDLSVFHVIYMTFVIIINCQQLLSAALTKWSIPQLFSGVIDQTFTVLIMTKLDYYYAVFPV